jgi:recombination protein RecA
MADDRLSADRGRAGEAASANIEKKFGKRSIMRLGERDVSDIPAISTTSLSLDAAIGVGGVPRGRIVEIYGPEGSGKTTLALHIVAEAQEAGGVAAYIDAEHAMDADYAGKLGVDVDQLLISQPDSGEQALEIAEALVRSNGIDVIVVDSVAALVPRAELDGEIGDSLPGLQARLMSQVLRKLTAIVAQSNTCFIFINQIREKIGVMFSNPETTTGGRALKFYSSLRLDIRRIGAIKDGDRVVGNRTKVKVAKNKVAPPFRECEFDIMYGEGISREGDLLDLATTQRVVEKSGAWFSYKSERLGQGRENAKQALRDNPEVLRRIEREVKVKLGIPVREPDGGAVKALGVSSSEQLSESLTPEERLAIGENWQKMNAKRVDLIRRKLRHDITATEERELEHLQRLADKRIRLLSPLPIERLETLLNEVTGSN